VTDLSNYAENQVADALFNNDVGSLPVATVYCKLHLGDPGEDGTGSPAVETDREVVSFGAASGGVSTSDADSSWASVAATETYSHVSLWDAVSAGNCLAYGALTSPKAVNLGDTFTIPSGSLTVTFD
jgi:hypothetical protein